MCIDNLAEIKKSSIDLFFFLRSKSLSNLYTATASVYKSSMRDARNVSLHNTSMHVSWCNFGTYAYTWQWIIMTNHCGLIMTHHCLYKLEISLNWIGIVLSSKITKLCLCNISLSL